MEDKLAATTSAAPAALPSASTWASIYSLDDYSASFSGDEAQKIRKRFQYLATGSLSALPLLCAPACPFRERCVFVEIDKQPLGKICLVESSLVREWVVGFLLEYEVPLDSLTDRYLVQELVELELLNFRINSILSLPENADLSVLENISFDREGNVLSNRVVNGLLELKLKLGARKDKIIKSMVGDRQEKYKKQAALKLREGGDPASLMSDMRRKLEQLQRDLKQVKSLPIEAQADPLEEYLEK